MCSSPKLDNVCLLWRFHLRFVPGGYRLPGELIEESWVKISLYTELSELVKFYREELKNGFPSPPFIWSWGWGNSDHKK